MPQSKPFSETVIKLILPFLLLVVLIYGSIFFIFLPMADSHVDAHRKESLADLTMTGVSVLNYYQSLEEKNVCSRKLAQESAKNNIRNLRFGKDKKNYFFVIDVRGYAQLNPYRPDLEGNNQLHLQDVDGKFFINEIIDVAKKDGEGFVHYKWQVKDNPNQVKGKISHVRIFSPWGWVIGAGSYADEHDDDLEFFTWMIVLVTLLIVILIATLYTLILKNFISSENKKRSSFEKLLSQEEKIRALLEAIPDMILRIDREGMVLDFKEPMGYKPFIDPSDLLDSKIIDTWDKKAAEKVIAAIERVFVTTEHQTLVFDYPSDSGKMKIEAHFAMSDHNEILATFRDISGR